MTPTGLRRFISVIVLWCLAAAVIAAQPDRIRLRFAPAPGQSARMTMTHEMDMEMSLGGDAVPGLPGPLQFTSRARLVFRQTAGAARPDGRYDVEIVFEDISATGTMNGQDLPTSDAGDQMRNKPIVVTYDAGGQAVNVRAPDVPGLTPETFTQMMAAFHGNAPAAALAVGETARVPMNVTLPLPFPAAGAPTVNGEVVVRLAALEAAGGRRSARVESTMEGSTTHELDIPAPNGTARMRSVFALSGTGVTALDPDAGIVRSGDVTTDIDGTFSVIAGDVPTALQGMTLKGRVHVTLRGE